MSTGKALDFSLANLQDRGILYIEAGEEVYEGMVVGNTSKGQDMIVNPTKGKQLTNMRASGTDGITKITPKKNNTLEEAMGLMRDDEFLEITPDAIERVRAIFKQYLDPNHPALLQWFGEYSSDTKTDIAREPEHMIEKIDELMSLGYPIQRHPASRFTFYRQGKLADLFIDGETYKVSIKFAEILCEQHLIDMEGLTLIITNSEKELLVNLYNSGAIFYEVI